MYWRKQTLPAGAAGGRDADLLLLCGKTGGDRTGFGKIYQKFNLGVVCAGSCAMEQNGQVLSLKAGDSFLIAAGAETYQTAGRQRPAW